MCTDLKRHPTHSIIKKASDRDFPGGLVAKTTHFQFRGHEFDPWSGNKDSICHMA